MRVDQSLLILASNLLANYESCLPKDMISLSLASRVDIPYY